MNLNQEYRQAFEKAKALYLAKAERIASSDSKLKRLLARARHKLTQLMDSPLIASARMQLNVFVRMLSAHTKGEYKTLSSRSIGLLVLGLFYFALPTDLVPDFIPFVGYVDDLSVLLGIYKSLQSDIEKFLEWEQQKHNPNINL